MHTLHILQRVITHECIIYYRQYFAVCINGMARCRIGGTLSPKTNYKNNNIYNTATGEIQYAYRNFLARLHA